MILIAVQSSALAAIIPAITSPKTASGVSGENFSYQITAVNVPTSYSAAGLPTGLTVNAQTGLISGSTKEGVFALTLRATNSAGTGTSPLSLTITKPLPVAKSHGDWAIAEKTKRIMLPIANYDPQHIPKLFRSAPLQPTEL